MLAGLAAACGAALAFGVAAVLQAVASRQEAPVRGVDPLLLARLVRHPAFVGALALNLLGFALHLLALRSLTLFLAQAAISSSVAVTALLAGRVLGVRPTGRDAGAVLAVCAGLVLLTAAGSEAGTADGAGLGPALLAAAAAVALAGALAGRLDGALGAALLGLTAGLGFAVVAVAGRVLPGLGPQLVRSPEAWALLAAGAVAFLLYATALQRAGVLTATAPLVLAQTVAPAAVGVVVLGDDVRPGGAPLAVVGLLLAVGGSALLARYDPAALSHQRGLSPRRPPAPRAPAGPPSALAGAGSSTPAPRRRWRR